MSRTTNDWQSIAEQLATSASLPEWEEVRASRQARVFYCGQDDLYLKFFYSGKLRHRLRDRLLPAQARHRRFVEQSHYLREHGLNAPAVIAHGCVGNTGYVVMKAFAGLGLGTFLANYLVQSRNDITVRRWKRRVMVALGKNVAKLHGAGVVHGDLRPDNILLSTTSAEPTFCFIDNERNQIFSRRIPSRLLVKNLSQLNMIWPADLGITYRGRFFNSYLRCFEPGIEPKLLIRRVAALTQKRLQGKAAGGYHLSERSLAPKPDFGLLLKGSP